MNEFPNHISKLVEAMALQHDRILSRFPTFEIPHRKLLDQIAPPVILPTSEAWYNFAENITNNWAALLRPRHAARVISAGYLPHGTTPQLPDGNDETVSDFLGEYYRANWPSVRSTLEASVDGCLLDDEARATFREALAAHDHGLYRCTVRTLLPEIERVARVHFELPTGGYPIPELRKLFRQMPLSDYGGYTRLKVMTTFLRHVWKETRTSDDLATVRDNPVPNRQASLHGLVSYSSFQNSLNTIFVTECVFAMLSIHQSNTLISDV